jgi:phosphoglycolate phosphatase
MTTRTVVFDMDGTLVQSRGAAWEVFQDTVREFDLPMSSAEEFYDLFRDNFFAGLAAFVGDPDRSRAVADHFLVALRERYTPELIPGMADVVHALAPHMALAVMSSNAMAAIRRTLESAGVAHCFAHVFSGDVEPDKAVSIRRILADPSYAAVRRCSPSYVEDGAAHARPAADEIVLVTDTVGDVREGVSCGIRVVGVAWGMHSAAELKAAGAEFVALWPQEIVARLLPDGSCTPGGCDCTSGACALPRASTAATGVGGRDVQGEAVAAAALRRARRQPVVVPAKAGCGCGCDGTSAASSQDPYLSVALAIIAATPP